jgi:release factor glutamine methyltransferase
MNILVKDFVFSPDHKITNSTNFLLNSIPDLSDKKALNLACGTGIVGLSCLKRGSEKVVFSDISRCAVQNTKVNLKNNFRDNESEIILSNLFDKIDQKFDYIFANLPILDGF